MNKNTLIALIVLLLLSCATDKGTVEQENPNEQTPEVLNDERKSNISSYSKRYSTNIIQELFDEAVQKDKDLKTVTSTLERVKELKTDSLESYNSYMSNNQNYWNALTQHSNQLSDSTLKKELLNLIATLKDKQSKRTSSLERQVAEIDSTARTLDDLEILMKIMVTAPMMYNYQRNELPNIRTLESVKQALDTATKTLKPYTKIEK